MFKSRILVAIVLSVILCVSAQDSEEDEGKSSYLKDFAEEFKTHIVDPQHLTCENYEGYCNAAGINDFGDTQSCKIWSENYLCNNGTDIESLRNTIQEIEDALYPDDS